MSDVSEHDKPEVHEELVKAVQTEDPNFTAHDPAVETQETYWQRLVERVETIADDTFTKLSGEAQALYEDLREKLLDLEGDEEDEDGGEESEDGELPEDHGH